MKRRLRFRYLVLGLVILPCILCSMYGFLIFRAIFDGNYGCFGTSFPTLADVAQNGWVTFPPSATNISWDANHTQCIADIQFDMQPEDLQFFLDAMKFERLAFTPDIYDYSGRKGHVIYKGDHFPTDDISTNFILALRGNERFNQMVWIDRHELNSYKVRVVSDQWPSSTTSRYVQTPGWFSNSITPAPVAP